MGWTVHVLLGHNFVEGVGGSIVVDLLDSNRGLVDDKFVLSIMPYVVVGHSSELGAKHIHSTGTGLVNQLPPPTTPTNL